MYGRCAVITDINIPLHNRNAVIWALLSIAGVVTDSHSPHTRGVDRRSGPHHMHDDRSWPKQ
jgi:hypothetical protein